MASSDNDPGQFEQAARAADVSFVRELWEFLRANRKWWLVPMLLVLGAVGLLVLLSGTAAAPFIYTLF